MSQFSLATRLVGNPRCWIVAGAILSLALAWLLWPAGPSPLESRQPPSPTTDPESPANTITSATEVFQKAFWKRPTDGDRILHAERREWSDENGIARWQWFIAVQPSPQLAAYLWDNNAFGLIPSARFDRQAAPPWFPQAAPNLEIRRSPQGNLTLVWNRADNILYGTDVGGGFRPGAPESAVTKPAARQTGIGGRLPLVSPPATKP